MFHYSSFLDRMKYANDQAMKRIYLLFLLCLCFTVTSCTNTVRSPWDSPSSRSENAAQAPQVIVAQPNIPQDVNSHNTYQNAPYGQNTNVAQPRQNHTPQANIAINNEFDTIYAEQNSQTKTQLPAYLQERPRPDRKINVAVLAPLSGKHSRLGQGLLQSAQMAMFELKAENINLIPRDTKGTADGAAIAARSAVQAGADIVLGPLFSGSVRAAKPYLKSAQIQTVAFTTDWSQADQNTFIMSFLPFAQVQRIAEYARQNEYIKVGILAPNTEYGNAVIAAYNSQAYRRNLPTAEIIKFSPDERDISGIVRTFAQYDRRKEELDLKIQDAKAHLIQFPNDRAVRYELDQLQEMSVYGEPPYDAVLLPIGGEQVRTIANLLSFYEMPPSTVKRLGTGLWDEAGIATEPGLEGGWFAAPSPDKRQNFEQRYKDIYSQTAPRLGTLAYDSMALVVALSRTLNHRDVKGTAPLFTHEMLTNPNGFAGVDGIFRFRPDGLVERGIAVMQFNKGTISIVDPAPSTFQYSY